MPLRLATSSDLGRISQIAAASFYDEELNDHIFPYRKQYPGDYVSVWKEKVVKSWWDYHKIWVVSYDEISTEKSGEVITGCAEWGREGRGADRLWGVVRWWDPSEYIMRQTPSRYFVSATVTASIEFSRIARFCRQRM